MAPSNNVVFSPCPPIILKRMGRFHHHQFLASFSARGFYCPFCNFYKTGQKNSRSLVFGQFLVPGFSALLSWTLPTKKEGAIKLRGAGQENRPKTSVMKPLFPVPGFWVVLFPGFFFTWSHKNGNKTVGQKNQGQKTRDTFLWFHDMQSSVHFS